MDCVKVNFTCGEVREVFGQAKMGTSVLDEYFEETRVVNVKKECSHVNVLVLNVITKVPNTYH